MVMALDINCTEIVEQIVKRRVEFNFGFLKMPVFGHESLHDFRVPLLERGRGPGLHFTLVNIDNNKYLCFFLTGVLTIVI